MWPAYQTRPGAQGFAGVHSDVHSHTPLDSLQQDFLTGTGIERNQPCGEALVPLDVSEQRHVAVAHRHGPGHAGVEVVIHADGEARWFGRGPG